ncbi:MAG: ATP-binding cassette domain-containing protein [Clostridia bacterium]|nr:ATP-binding cassette domain-containing protein [Clostridia bacterium]
MGVIRISDICLKIKQKLLFSGDMTLYPGTVTVLYGEVGSGKSTFVKNLMKLKQMKCEKDGINVKKNYKWLFNCGYVCQDIEGYNRLTMAEFENLFLKNARYTFADMHLQFVKDKKIKNCSKGEKQRLCILRALAKNPELLLLDEPFSFLDIKTRRTVLNILKDYTTYSGCSTLIISHYILDLDDVSQIYQVNDCKLISKKEYEGPIETFKLNNRTKNHPIIQYAAKKKIIFQWCIFLIVLFLSLFGKEIAKRNYDSVVSQWFDSHRGFEVCDRTDPYSLPIYRKEMEVTINDNSETVYLMNYYSGINMRTKLPHDDNEVLVSEHLFKQYGGTMQIQYGDKNVISTNCVDEDAYLGWENRIHMIYDPNFVGEKEDIIFYVFPYKNEEDLKKVKDVNLYQDYLIKTTPAKNQKMLCFILSIAAIGIVFFLTNQYLNVYYIWIYEEGISQIFLWFYRWFGLVTSYYYRCIGSI